MWGQIAALVGQKLIGAEGQAQQANSQIGSNNRVLKGLRSTLGSLDDLTLANQEGAIKESQTTFESIGKKLSESSTDFHAKSEDINRGGFAKDAASEEAFDEGFRRLNSSFADEAEAMNMRLEKTLAGFTAEGEGKRLQIEGQIKEIQASNKSLKKNSKWYQNIF